MQVSSLVFFFRQLIADCRLTACASPALRSAAERRRGQARVSQPFTVTGDIRFLDYLALRPFAAFDYQNFGLITIKTSEMSGKTVATIPPKYHL
jgi:hypothetical protein